MVLFVQSTFNRFVHASCSNKTRLFVPKGCRKRNLLGAEIAHPTKFVLYESAI